MTPQVLLDGGLYRKLAVPLAAGIARNVSYALLAKEVGARQRRGGGLLREQSSSGRVHALVNGAGEDVNGLGTSSRNASHCVAGQGVALLRMS